MSHWNPPAVPDPTNPATQQPWLYFGAGAAIAVGLHALVGLGLFGTAAALNYAARYQWIDRGWESAAPMLWLMWLMTLSVFQLLYLGPAWGLTRRWRPPMGQGILVVGVITFLLQGTCYALVFGAGALAGAWP